MDKLSITKKIAGSGVFAALAFVVSFWEFPIFPAPAEFLKLDFSSVLTLLAGFVYGPVSGICVCAVKELLCLTKGSTGGVGELANFLITSSFIALPTIVYAYKKGFKTVAVTLVAACVIQNVVALVVNRFINFPLYMGSAAADMFETLKWYILAFNYIKTFAVGIITVLLYKKVSGLIKKI